jgi:hypothetical protein
MPEKKPVKALYSLKHNGYSLAGKSGQTDFNIQPGFKNSLTKGFVNCVRPLAQNLEI